MLSAAELTEMRATEARLMTDAAVIAERDPDEANTDPFGAPSPGAFTPIATFVSIAPAGTGGSVGLVASKLESRLAWVLSFPALTDVRPRDVVTVGSRRFTVEDVLGPETIETKRRVVATEVR